MNTPKFRIHIRNVSFRNFGSVAASGGHMSSN